MVSLYFACFGKKQVLEAGRIIKLGFSDGFQDGNSWAPKCWQVDSL